MKRDELLAEIIRIAHGAQTDAAQFAKHYLETHPDLTYELRAGLFETLARDHSSQRVCGEFYKQAASAWEMHYLTSDHLTPVMKRVLLKKTLTNYRRSYRAFENAKERTLANEIRSRVARIQVELRTLITPIRKASIGFVFLSLMFSFFFLAPNFTGLSISPLDSAESNMIGIVLMILGVLGLVFVLWRLR